MADDTETRTSRSDSPVCSSGSESNEDVFEKEGTPQMPSSPSRKTKARKISERGGKTRSKIVYTAGRPPWYDSNGQLKKAFMIGICGGSASGKTTVAKKIISELGVPWVVILSLDSFYKVLSHEQHEAAGRNEYNFDHPDAFDFDLAVETMKKLKEGRSVQVPIYDFTSHSRLAKQKTVYGANVVIFEGIMTFVSPELLDILDMKVFVDTDSDIRLARRLKRDISERGRDLIGVLKQYDTFVKPMFEQYIAPSMKTSDIVVPWEGENTVAINLIVQHVRTQLEKPVISRYFVVSFESNAVKIGLIMDSGSSQQRGFNFRSKLVTAHKGQPLPDNLHIVEDTPQHRGLQAIIRDKNCARDDFVFYSQRLMRILIEKAMSLLPFKSHICTTVHGSKYNGVRFAGAGICGVSILRAGEALEDALVSVSKDAKIGKILIQTNKDTDEPELHYLRLPKDIRRDHVILMDATVASGAAEFDNSSVSSTALMAIRILLDHEVKEENIMFVSLIMGKAGVHSIAFAFPKVKIVTTAVDSVTNENYHIIPGIGILVLSWSNGIGAMQDAHYGSPFFLRSRFSNHRVRLCCYGNYGSFNADVIPKFAAQKKVLESTTGYDTMNEAKTISLRYRHGNTGGMSKERYNDLLSRLKEKLTFGKNHRYPISADERLVLTLRYLAHGDAQQNLAITGRYGSELSDEKKVYNYRHSRARRISENAFGILSARWRVFGRTIEANPENSVTITKACIALHNYLAKTDFQNTPKARYVPPTLVDQELQGDVVPGTWREIQANSIRAINRVGSNMSSKQATKYREQLKDFFLTDEGSVPWQETVVRRGRLQK
eukprot:gene7854-13732_t